MIGVEIATLRAAADAAIPVDPDAPDARQLLIDELSRPPYREAQPNWFDQLSQGFLNWIASLFEGSGGIGTDWLAVIAFAVVAVIVVVALLVWGVPRLNRRSRSTSALFGEHDTRSAVEMRAAAAQAAARADWPLAIAEQFRALATDLAERTIVTVSPGTTATDFARSAARAISTEAEALIAASAIFDEVRYLEHPGSEADYRTVRELDERLRSTKPVTLDGLNAPNDNFSGVNGGLS